MSLAQSLFTSSQAQVYAWLFGLPERAYHWNELSRLTKLGSASLQRELNRLVDAGVVTSERVGNLRRFQANAASPVFTDLVNLTRKTLGVVPALQDALQPLAAKLELALVFGSVAKQTDTAQSDIDVMLVGDALQIREVLELLIPLEAQLGRKINPTCYTPAEFARRRMEEDSFVQRVLAQPTLPLLGEMP
jgi:predicted nucleotidyltransferase